MSHPIIDLRSDTVTKPTPAMREAICNAEVDDDVIGVDPTADRLQRRIAEILGKEDAVFMPSGSMTNQVAIRVHCQPGDEFFCETGCHIFNYEQGAFAQLSGVVARTFDGIDGVLTLSQLEDKIRPENDHLVRTRLVTLENTHNRGGGKIQPYEEVVRICHWARKNELRTHLDGARLFNAVVATGVAADQWAQHFDTVSVCFSKGLGAPVGSALAGPSELIRQARRHRKAFGGGMRQCGVIAAGALYALDHHIDRLAEDHANARILADAIEQSDGIALAQESVDTNIVFFNVQPQLATARQFNDRLKQRGVLMLVESPTKLRALTHLDVNREQVEQAAQIVHEVAESFAVRT